jgi:hypothetical protein
MSKSVRIVSLAYDRKTPSLMVKDINGRDALIAVPSIESIVHDTAFGAYGGEEGVTIRCNGGTRVFVVGVTVAQMVEWISTGDVT